MRDLGLATRHAIERYQERVENLPDDEVAQILSTPAIRMAADMGCPGVKLASGHRAVLQNGKVVTIHPKKAQWVS